MIAAEKVSHCSRLQAGESAGQVSGAVGLHGDLAGLRSPRFQLHLGFLGSPIFLWPGLLQIFRLSYCINLTNWRLGGWGEGTGDCRWEGVERKKGGKTP